MEIPNRLATSKVIWKARFQSTAAVVSITAMLHGFVPTATAQPVIVGWDSTRGGVSSLLTAAGYASTRASIAANFPGSSIRGVASLNASSLDGANVVWIGTGRSCCSATTPLAASEQSALLAFVSAGGVALVFGDNSTFASNAVVVNTSYFQPFAVTIAGTLSGTQPYTLAASQIYPMTGLFGQVSALSSSYPGWFTSMPAQGAVLARLTNNTMPVIANLPSGALGPGSGAVWLFADTGSQGSGGVQGGNWNTLYLNILSSIGRVQVTSSQSCTALPVPGSLSLQLGTLNAIPPPYNPQTWLPVWRHQDLHAPASFTCGDPGQNQIAPYISTEAFLNGADEVTYNNCGSAFYRFTFELPIGFSNAALSGVANVDDIAVAWLNGNQISATMLPTDAQVPVLDRTDAQGRRVLNWPTTDPIGTTNQTHFRPGTNELVFSVCGDATEFEPTGLEFTGTVSFLGGQTTCYPNCDASTAAPVLNVNDFICFLNRFAASDPTANCDGSTTVPVLNVNDFICFNNQFAAGCP